MGGSPVLSGALVAWQGLFNDAELDAVARMGDALALEKAELSAAGQGYDDIRRTLVAWLARSPETDLLYRRLEDAVLTLNARFFRFDLSGLPRFNTRFMAARMAGISTGTRIMVATLPIPRASRAS